MSKQDLEIFTIPDEKVLEAFSKPDGVSFILEKVTEQAERLKKDVDSTTNQGRKQVATNARKFATFKTRTDAIGKGSTDELRATINAVNANRNKLKSKLDLGNCIFFCIL